MTSSVGVSRRKESREDEKCLVAIWASPEFHKKEETIKGTFGRDGRGCVQPNARQTINELKKLSK